MEPELSSPSSKIVDSLKTWFIANRRDLPWRPQSIQEIFRPAYNTWISEIMLQQTQVATVIEKYEQWMRSFPDIFSLANSPETQVLEKWAGLGYYSRARNILKCAQILVAEHQGEFPQDRSILEKLPGIGSYTAGAILSLAFNQAEAILDGNLIRIFSRYYALNFLPDRGTNKSQYWQIAHHWAQSAPFPGLINEALMELGALICTPKSPKCTDCPLKLKCCAHQNQQQEFFPPAKVKKTIQVIEDYWLVITLGEKVFLIQKKDDTLLKKDWKLPRVHPSEIDIFKQELKRNHMTWTELFPSITHAITQYRIKPQLLLVKIESNKEVDRIVKMIPHDALLWSTDPQKDSPSSLTKKIMNQLERQP